MLNNYFIIDCPYAKLCLLIVRLPLYCKVCMIVIPFVLADGTYELISESEGGDQEAHVNAAILTEDSDQSPEEPTADLASDYREGKPRT